MVLHAYFFNIETLMACSETLSETVNVTQLLSSQPSPPLPTTTRSLPSHARPPNILYIDELSNIIHIDGMRRHIII